MAAGIGHNSDEVLSETTQGQLRSILERAEKLDDEKTEVVEARKTLMAEAKGNGFDVKAINALLRLRKKDAAKLAEERAMLELYASAVGNMDLVS